MSDDGGRPGVGGGRAPDGGGAPPGGGRTPDGGGPRPGGGDTPIGDVRPIDWEALAQAARQAMERAYVPYSNFPVGAAALTDGGRIISGCNVENASYGLTLCAECTLVGNLQMTGGGRLVAFYCVDSQANVLMPCGRCRQLLYEFRAPGMQLMTTQGIRTMEQVLPDAFGPDNLTFQTTEETR